MPPEIVFTNVEGLNTELWATELQWVPPAAISATEVFSKALAKYHADCRAGLIFDGPIQIPVAITQRMARDGFPVTLTIETQRSSYCVSRALSDFAMAHLNKSSGFEGGLGVDVLVISNDGLVITGTRSNKVGKWPGYRFFALGEGVDARDSRSLELVAARCLQEELALDDLAAVLSAVKVVQVSIEPTHRSLSGFAIADLRGMGEAFNASSIVQKAALSQDGWENNGLTFVPIEQALSLLVQDVSTPGSHILVPIAARLLKESALDPALAPS